MESILYIRDHPGRSVALHSNHITNSVRKQFLVFEKGRGLDSNRPQCNVKLLNGREFNGRNYRKAIAKPVYGCLGLLQVEDDMFIEVVTDCEPVGYVSPGESVHRIRDVEFYSLTNDFWDNKPKSYTDENGVHVTHPCASLKKLLSNGRFYFSSDFDLTRTLQARRGEAYVDKYLFDEHFLWNKFMINELLGFRVKLEEKDKGEMDNCGFLVLAIQGYVGILSPRTHDEHMSIALISKLSCKRAGTRFITRGIDDDGNVANFVETETIMHVDKWSLSYTQVRGSIPVFWEQQGLQFTTHKLQVTRSPAATLPAFQRHFSELCHRYGNVHCINLVSQKGSEETLSREYNNQIAELRQTEGRISISNFDFHAMCKNGSYENIEILINMIRDDLEDMGYFLWGGEGRIPTLMQSGAFRTNCIDCLDRTNVIQCEVSKKIIHNYLAQISYVSNYELQFLFDQHSFLWAENGDSLSKIYAGTGALKTDYTRSGKLTFTSLVNDATKSVNRFYINNFADKSKQEVIDLLLGKAKYQKPIIIHDPIRELVIEQIQKRLHDFSTKSVINVFVSTYNLNGKLPSREPLDNWLFAFGGAPNLYVIGFQEIVELKPQQIVSADPEKLVEWEKAISNTLGRHPSRHKYILLRSSQLVGTALIIYARADVVPAIRNIEGATKKTGLGGMAGNKGAVAIKMDYYDTDLCFVTTHFFAGHSNVAERNRDFNTINSGLTFKKGRLAELRNVIWFGDLNYRIDLFNDEVRNLAAMGNLDALLRSDQLNVQRKMGFVFDGCHEEDITFLPTYKYDNGTQTYDTSEKQRIPAWTDRILYRGAKISQNSYARAELLLSDHRPVMGSFDIEIVKYDEVAKEKIMQELYSEMKYSSGSAPITGLTASKQILTSPPAYNNNEHNDELIIDCDEPTAMLNDLPPPSSDTYQWWNESASSSSLIIDKSRLPPRTSESTNPFYESSPRENSRNPFDDDTLLIDI